MREILKREEVEPQSKELTQAFSTAGLVSASIEEIVEIAQKAGANIELSLNRAIAVQKDNLGLEEWAAYVHSLTQKAGIEVVSAHTGIQFNLAGFAPKNWQLRPPSLKDQMLMAKALGVFLTLHPESFWGTDTEYGEGLTQGDLLTLVQETGAEVSLELILWRPPVDQTKDFYGRDEKRRLHPGTATRREILNFLEQVARSNPHLLSHFGITLDVGYVFRRPIESSQRAFSYLRRVYEGIQNLGKRHGIDSLIKIIHLYNASGWQEEAKGGLQTFQHRTLPLGQGELPLFEFIHFLKERNFSGIVVHERMLQYLGEGGIKILLAVARMAVYELGELKPRWGRRLRGVFWPKKFLGLPQDSIAKAIKREVQLVKEVSNF